MTSDSREQAPSYPNKPPTAGLDWVMLALAVLSLVLLVVVTFFTVSAEAYRVIVRLDYLICAIFAAEFLWRWGRAGWIWKFPLVYWYEVLGMIPVTNPIFRGFRLLRIVVVLARLARATDRAVGDRVVAAVTARLTRRVVEEIKRPITIAVLDEVADVLRTGNYTRNISAALEENRSEMDEMILELIRKDKTTGKLKWLPFHDDIVRLIGDTTFRIVSQMLADPRTDEFVSDLLRENIEQIRISVRRKEQPRLPRT